MSLIESPFSSCSRQISETPELSTRLTTKPGTSAQVIGLLADRLGEGERRGHGLGGGLLAFDDLDQRHHRGRVEVVEADHLFGAQGGVGDLGDRQRGGVRGEDRVPGRARVELGEDGLLDRPSSRAPPRSRSRPRRSPRSWWWGGSGPASPGHLASPCSALSAPLLDQFGDLAGGYVLGLVDAGLDQAPRRCPSGSPVCRRRRSSGRSGRPSCRRPRRRL